MSVKRAGEVMRREYLRIPADATLAEAALAIRDFRLVQPDMDVAAVFDKESFLGLTGHFAMLKELQKTAMNDSLRLSVGPEDFAATFREECARSLLAPVRTAVDGGVPAASPEDPLFLVMDAMLRSDRPHAVVMQEGRLLGLILAGDALLALRLDAAPAV